MIISRFLRTTPSTFFFRNIRARYDKRELHIHIHITFFGSKEHKDKLLFRDYLRHHSDEAKTYYDLKKQWSTEAGPDGSKYAELKTSYINEVLEKARRELKD